MGSDCFSSLLLHILFYFYMSPNDISGVCLSSCVICNLKPNFNVEAT